MRAALADGPTATVPDVSTTEPPALIRGAACLTAATAPQNRTSNSRRLVQRQFSQWPRGDAVAGGVYQVIQLADPGERLGHGRLAAGVGDYSVAAAGQRGQGGVEPARLLHAIVTFAPAAAALAAVARSHSRAAADDHDVLAVKIHRPSSVSEVMMSH